MMPKTESSFIYILEEMTAKRLGRAVIKEWLKKKGGGESLSWRLNHLKVACYYWTQATFKWHTSLP